MTDLVFEWDERKNRANRSKHGVSFAQARSALLDENARVMSDPEHSEEEDRFILLGLSASLRILVACHCYPGRGVGHTHDFRSDREEQRQYRWWLR